MIFYSTVYPTGVPPFRDLLALSTGSISDFFILNDEPDWSNPVDMKIEAVIGSERSLDAKEARRPHASTARVKLGYSFISQGASARAAQVVLRSWFDQPIFCPVWPAAVEWQNRASATITGGLYIVWNAEWLQWRIYEAASVPTVYAMEIGYTQRTSNVATVGTTNGKPHNLRVGQVVSITGVTDATFNAASVTVTSTPSSSSFTYANTGSNTSLTASTAGFYTMTIGANDMVAPLLWGRMAKRDSDWISGDVGKFIVNFEEDGPAVFAMGAATQTWAALLSPTRSTWISSRTPQEH